MKSPVSLLIRRALDVISHFAQPRPLPAPHKFEGKTNREFLFAIKRGEMTTIEMTGDGGEQQEESGQDVALTSEMELALGRVLLPVFAGYLQKMGFLEVGERQTAAKNDVGGEMTIEETVNRLAGAQLGHTFRLSRIEDGFQQIAVAIQQLTQIAVTTDGKVDGNLVALDGRFERIDEILRRVVELQSESAAQIKSLIAAQARMDEQIRLLLDQNGSTPRPKAEETVKKTVKRRSVKDP